MRPSVSILVPIYNVSDFIERCAHSLFQQTFKDIEYVFVNDCTPDDSVEKLQKVIERYPNRKSFTKIIHHERNRGLAASRLTGLANAEGRFIQIVDSDDYVEVDMTELLYNKAVENDADIVVCDFFEEHEVGNTYIEVKLFEEKEQNIIGVVTGDIPPTLWKQLIKRELFLKEDMFIEGLNYAEDVFANVKLFYYAQKTTKIEQALYHRQYNTQSITQSRRSQMYFENTIYLWESLDFFFKKINVLKKYNKQVEFQKVKYKVSLITGTDSYKLRKQYAWLFRDIEMRYIKRFRTGEKLILFFTHYRCYVLAQLTHKLLVLKNKKHAE